MPAEQFSLNWRASKETLARFAGELREIMSIRDVGGRVLIDGFIYDLGHYGRGLSDFPFIMPLEAEDEQILQQGDKAAVIRLEVSSLMAQLMTRVEPYAETHRWRT